MKTIQEAAKKYEIHNGLQIWSENNNSPIALCIESFKAGVEFAQRWIPVSEELPEENFNDTGIQFGFDLLIKCPNCKIYLGDRKWSDSHHNFIWRYKDGSRVYDVTHWRPINLE